MKAEVEIRGRLMCLETMVLTLLAHTAAHISNPAQFTTQVMANVEEILDRERNAHLPDDSRQVLEAALQSFHALTGPVLAHLNKHAAPQGSA